MALKIPTNQESFTTYLNNLEAKLNQTSPLNDKSFLVVLSALEAAQDGGQYKFSAERVLQVLALTATGTGLDDIGAEYGVPRKPGESAILTVTLPGINGTIIPAGTDFTGTPNGVRYTTSVAETVTGGIATLSVTAEPGSQSNGNLNNTNEMTIGTQIPGAETVATVTATENVGADEETDEAYRPRVLNAVRSTCGGGNAQDHKLWSEEVAGVFRTFPYAGKPPGTGTSFPGDRTVYVEADTTIDPDGIAPQSLLDEVRTSIGQDPSTFKSRPPLGITDDTLSVPSISRTAFFVEVRNLAIAIDKEAKAKSEIDTSLDVYFRTIAPFVDGVDVPIDRNDLITDLTVSLIVQDVLTANGGSADGIGFGLTVGTFLPSYLLGQGETGKLGGVTYV